ncbi:hypothetical protein PMAYCL1PPCAC_03588 [Pristionchus mayeri]|uniref:Uncharacterized protein n=1 Tax=Pristionchus mayeri TaxID=1317129 RepID=A0AAN5C1J3_9BILA|nr:hypothetical protein PMAYCL1PPCAC_03565 [Pristionchus mayeri]GMR33373.1 hypothetical protein PMAYCL1PPCAC_03568 [Pristionchus mayeri]GMR33381.1 hypothetical protein PMAYCL1PPCAC_03576 [Pristionchus mayeri]GMR33386.1 hypothetical protein PMAYCL1PPCAC_03581 [Pristionchus mayeri]GMR33388.1 hypothetical protein PMAYCL1PPCAC_03583 [Pristionchus mayeri]
MVSPAKLRFVHFDRFFRNSHEIYAKQHILAQFVSSSTTSDLPHPTVSYRTSCRRSARNSKPVARVVDEAPKKSTAKHRTTATPSKKAATPAPRKSRATTAAAAAKTAARAAEKKSGETPSRKVERKGTATSIPAAPRRPSRVEEQREQQQGAAPAATAATAAGDAAATAFPVAQMRVQNIFTSRAAQSTRAADEPDSYSIEIELGAIRALAARHMVYPDRKAVVIQFDKRAVMPPTDR